jgi:hypothetical protein
MGKIKWAPVRLELFRALSEWLPAEFEIVQTESGVAVTYLEGGSTYSSPVDGIALQSSDSDPDDIWAAVFSALDGIQDFVMESTTDQWPGGSHAQPVIESCNDTFAFGYQDHDEWVFMTSVFGH